MKSKFFGLLAACLFFGAVNSREAVAITYEFEYQGVGTGFFIVGGQETLNIGGTCSDPCGIGFALFLGSVAGPAFDAATGAVWGADLSAMISDGVDPTFSVGFSNGSYIGGTKYTVQGGGFYASIVPSVLNLSSRALIQSTGGPTDLSYKVLVALPDGLYVTPLPPTWTMMIIGLAGLGFVAYRRHRKEAAFAA